MALYSDLVADMAVDLTTNSFGSTTNAYAMYILYNLSMHLCIISIVHYLYDHRCRLPIANFVHSG